MKNNIYRLIKNSAMLLALLMAMACNPLSIDEPLTLAGDFSDSIFPKTYGRVSVNVELSDDVKPSETATKASDLLLEFYFITEDGKYRLCKEYSRAADMPSVTLFPIGNYIVVARSENADNGAYLVGTTKMTVTKDKNVIGKIICKLMAGDFSDPIYPKSYGNVALEVKLMTIQSFVPDTKSQKIIEKPNINKMIVEFYFIKPDGDSILAKKYVNYELMPSIAMWPTGMYTVKVKSHENLKEVGDSAYFDKQIRLVVNENQVSDVVAECEIRNAKVGVELSKGFNNAFSSWEAKLVFKGENDARVTFSNSNLKPVFVNTDAFEVTFEGIQNVDNKVISKVFELTNVKPGNDILINLSGSSTGNLKLEFYINGQIVRNDHEVDFPDSDEELGGGGTKPEPEPDPENPDEKPDPEPNPDLVPTIIGTGFNVDKIKEISTVNDFVMVDEIPVLKSPLKVVANASEKIQQFVITIDSPDIGEDLLKPLFGGTSFDLANVPDGSDLVKNLNSLGILPIGTPVKNTTSFTFDLTAFMSLLPENTLTHNFVLKVVDSKNNVVEKKIRIKRIP